MFEPAASRPRAQTYQTMGAVPSGPLRAAQWHAFASCGRCDTIGELCHSLLRGDR